MKGHYITVYSRKFLGEGIYKKVTTQVNCLRQAGIDIDILSMEDTNQQDLLSKIKRRLPFCCTYVNYKYDEMLKQDDFIYLRYQGADYNLINFLKKLKSKNPLIKIIVEIPTYPYEKEQDYSLKGIGIIVKDRYNRLKLHKYVDCLAIVSQSNIKKLFGIKVINIKNGIDFESVLPRKILSKTSNSLNLICVSRFSKWHGCERLIEGLNIYYNNTDRMKKREVVLNLVGDGTEIEKYKNMVKKYGLQKRVIFHGIKTSDELDLLYDNADIAIESLNRIDSGINISCSLKSREYLAKGLPMISGGKIDIIDEQFPYLYVLPSSGTIDIQKIFEFHDSIFKNEMLEDVIKKIRLYGKKRVDISSTLKPIINYINSINSRR